MCSYMCTSHSLGRLRYAYVHSSLRWTKRSEVMYIIVKTFPWMLLLGDIRRGNHRELVQYTQFYSVSSPGQPCWINLEASKPGRKWYWSRTSTKRSGQYRSDSPSQAKLLVQHSSRHMLNACHTNAWFVTLEEVPVVTENAAGRQEGTERNRHVCRVKHKLLQARHLPWQHRMLLNGHDYRGTTGCFRTYTSRGSTDCCRTH